MLKVIENKNDWDLELVCFKSSFLQSYEWGEVLEKSGQKIERLVIENDNTKLAAMLVFKKLPLGKKFVFIPYGPLTSSKNEKNWQELIRYIKEQGSIFLKIEPADLALCPDFIKEKIKLVKDVNPMATMVLSLKRTEEEILSSFHQKTRYNINLASRKDLKVVWGKNFPIFWDLMEKTGERDGFALHPEKNYRAAVESASTNQVTIYSSGIPVAVACFWVFNGICYYLYGASDHSYRQLMAPYLVQWEAIKMAKANGCGYYDFFGIAPTENPNHRYAGVTRFKLGFNGQIVETPGTFDLPLNSFWYGLYFFSRRLRGLSV